MAIVGPNGAGKTTLVKLLLGELAPDAGTVKLGTNLEIAYLDQAPRRAEPDMTLWDALTPGGGDSILVRGQPKHVAAYAKDFLFKDSQLRQPVATLSGGERNRLLLARALAKPANLLVLDEPTNDLDMDTLDLLEDLLADYEGTLILVSHDRDFIDRLATSTIALDGRGDVVETPGGWKDFLRQNPGFFEPGANPRPQDKEAAQRAAAAPAPAPRPEEARQADLQGPAPAGGAGGLIAALPEEIARLEATPGRPRPLRPRPARPSTALIADARRGPRRLLAAAEEEWLALEEKRRSAWLADRLDRPSI